MTEPYTSAAAVEAAIRDAARNASASDKSASTQDRIRQEYFRRFLSRIFSERDDSGWLLKGGTGVLARVASGRSTMDVDLFRANNTLDGALTELIRLSTIDLGDFFRFVYTKHEFATRRRSARPTSRASALTSMSTSAPTRRSRYMSTSS